MTSRNDTIAACLGILDRHPAPRRAVGLTADERRLLVASGKMGLRPGVALSPAALARKLRGPGRPADYGKSTRIAREYLSRPRLRGEMVALAAANGLRVQTLHNAIAYLKAKLKKEAA